MDRYDDRLIVKTNLTLSVQRAYVPLYTEGRKVPFLPYKKIRIHWGRKSSIGAVHLVICAQFDKINRRMKTAAAYKTAEAFRQRRKGACHAAVGTL